jgi:N-acyl-D-aspartate/D-glutamate deacylase
MSARAEPGLSLVAVVLLIGLCQASLGQDYDLAGPDLTPPATLVSSGVTLYQNVRIFDGTSTELSTPSNVLVRGNTIERISVSPINVDTDTNVRVIAGDGRVLMPGLIDAHWHAFMAAIPQMLMMTADPSYLHLLAARQAKATLMRGFTTVRATLAVPSSDSNAPSTKASYLVRAFIPRALSSHKPQAMETFASASRSRVRWVAR